MRRLVVWALATPVAAALALAPAAARAQSPQAASPEPPAGCCRFSTRFDAFQLIFRRLAFEAEVKIAGPFSVGATPAWIWGGSNETLSEQGFQLLGFAAWTFYGTALRGFWLRAVGGFEAFDATLTHPDFPDVKVKKGVATGIFGLMVGDSVVFGQDGGVAVSAGVGAGVATSDPIEIIAPSPDPDVPSARATYYQDASRVKLLGTLGLGVTF